MKILVLGDTCIDVSHFGKVERISSEAPIPIFNHERTEQSNGMASNVQKALETLGAETYSHLSNNQIIKERYFVGNHYLFRADLENIESPAENTKSEVLKTIKNINPDAIIMSDYAKGFFDEYFIQRILSVTSKDCLIIADGHSSRDPEFYIGIDYLKLNEKEFKSIFKEEFSLQRIKDKIRHIIVTRGNKSTLVVSNNETKEVPVPTINNIVDVTSAGDIFTAHLAYNLLSKQSLESSIENANKAASLSCTKLGSFYPKLEDLK